MCSGRVCSSCSTYGTRRITLAMNPVICHEWGKNRIVIKGSFCSFLVSNNPMSSKYDQNHKHVNLLSLFHKNSIMFKVNVRGFGVYFYFQQLLAMSWLEDVLWEENPVSYSELNGKKNLPCLGVWKPYHLK